MLLAPHWEMKALDSGRSASSGSQRKRWTLSGIWRDASTLLSVAAVVPEEGVVGEASRNASLVSRGMCSAGFTSVPSDKSTTPPLVLAAERRACSRRGWWGGGGVHVVTPAALGVEHADEERHVFEANTLVGRTGHDGAALAGGGLELLHRDSLLDELLAEITIGEIACGTLSVRVCLCTHYFVARIAELVRQPGVEAEVGVGEGRVENQDL